MSESGRGLKQVPEPEPERASALVLLRLPRRPFAAVLFVAFLATRPVVPRVCVNIAGHPRLDTDMLNRALDKISGDPELLFHTGRCLFSCS